MTADAFALPRVVDMLDLGGLDDPIARNNGQSVAVRPIRRYDGYLVKMYVAPLAGPDCRQLDRLIALPAAADARDRRLIREHTAWPVARVDSGRIPAVGCVLPVAPEKFRADLRLTPTHTDRRYLDVDWLARPDEVLTRRGLTVPGSADRLRVCRQIMEVAALLARHNLVYSDWSYSNAFFSAVDWSAYVIDIDGCAERLGPNVFQPNWDDPLTGSSAPADTFTDRYRTALLVGRILSGENHPARMMLALSRHPDQTLAAVLLDVLRSPKRQLRPPPSAVLAVLDGLPYLRVPFQRLPLPPDPGGRRKPPVRKIPPVPPAPVGVAPPASPSRRAPVQAATVTAWVAVIAVVVLLIVLAAQH